MFKARSCSVSAAIGAAMTCLALSSPALADPGEAGELALPELLERGLTRLLDEIAPSMDELADQMKDLPDYHLPEILPNGDIIIRRKRPEAPGDPSAPVDL